MIFFRKKALTEDEKRKRMSRAFVEWYLYRHGWADHRAVVRVEKEMGLL